MRGRGFPLVKECPFFWIIKISMGMFGIIMQKLQEVAGACEYGRLIWTISPMAGRCIGIVFTHGILGFLERAIPREVVKISRIQFI